MKLTRVNTCLVVAIVAVNGYIVAAPFWPRLTYWWQDRDQRNPVGTVQLQKRVSQPLTAAPAPQDNRLVIPAMHLDQPIVGGSTERALMQGPWRRPHTSTPDKGGNTVIAGHRFTYDNPRGSFYFLDRLQTGDELAVFWQGVRYRYRVDTVRVVGPSDTAVEDPQGQDRLTLYTCTPLWSPKQRLVVVAHLEAHD